MAAGLKEGYFPSHSHHCVPGEPKESDLPAVLKLNQAVRDR